MDESELDTGAWGRKIQAVMHRHNVAGEIEEGKGCISFKPKSSIYNLSTFLADLPPHHVNATQCFNKDISQNEIVFEFTQKTESYNIASIFVRILGIIVPCTLAYFYSDMLKRLFEPVI